MLNTTGIEPTEFNVLVRLERASEHTKGGVLLPGTKVERDQALNTRGTLIAASPLAFTYDDWKGLEDAVPTLGDRVIIAKGAGVYIDDLGDGEFYRLIKDKDVVAIRRDPAAAKKVRAA